MIEINQQGKIRVKSRRVLTWYSIWILYYSSIAQVSSFARLCVNHAKPAAAAAAATKTKKI